MIKKTNKYLIGIVLCIIFLLGLVVYKAAPLFKTQTPLSTATLTQKQKIDKSFSQMRLANNPIEAQALETQLFLEMSQPKFASTKLLFENAQKLSENGDLAGALEIYQTIQKLEPSFSEAHANGAYMAFQLGDKEMALKMLQNTVKLEPRHFAAWYGIGTLLDEKADIKGAKTAYENALYYNPNFDAAKRALFAIDTKTKGIIL